MTSCVLIIEDNTAFANVLAKMLEPEGYASVVAETVSDGRNCIQSGATFSAILLDIWLDGRSGLSLIDDIERTMPGTPVFVMSGGGGPLSLQVSSAIAEMKGIAGFLQKPISRDKLVTLLKKVA